METGCHHSGAASQEAAEIVNRRTRVQGVYPVGFSVIFWGVQTSSVGRWYVKAERTHQVFSTGCRSINTQRAEGIEQLIGFVPKEIAIFKGKVLKSCLDLCGEPQGLQP